MNCNLLFSSRLPLLKNSNSQHIQCELFFMLRENNLKVNMFVGKINISLITFSPECNFL